MKILIAVVMLVTNLIGQGLGGPLPHFNRAYTTYPQQVQNGNDLFHLGTCHEKFEIGIGVPTTSEVAPVIWSCGTQVKVINIGQTVEVFSHADQPGNCPQFFTNAGYPCIFLIDLLIQGCMPTFVNPTTIPFCESTANQYQLIYPDAFVPTHVLSFTLWGWVYHYYWSDFQVPFDPSLIGYWISGQSVRIDMANGMFYLSNRTDAMIGWVPPIN